MATSQMTPRISVITLGVNDLEQALAFYRDGLGWPTAGIIGTEFKGDETHPSGAIVNFHLRNGVILALYPRTELAKDATEPLGAASSTEFSIGYLARSKEEVDALMKQAEAAGATVTSHPYQRPFGVYSGYFKDRDGHLWEIIWNSEMVPEEG
ncbi:MAG TPA: VOC family protein [Ktedonobacterales bacterium]|nr:VOC family protein [Ktedonobacterales bacterium]